MAILTVPLVLLTLFSKMISLYHSEVKQVVQKVNLKADRDKQVQVRLPASLHKQLKLALIQDDSSLADFFNEAAEAYLKNPDRYKRVVGSINKDITEKFCKTFDCRVNDILEFTIEDEQ